MGWDAFGLPTEQYAIKTGTHPAVTTKQNVANFTAQLTQLGFAYDWEREVNTTDPGYFKWTQWIFMQLFKRALPMSTKSQSGSARTRHSPRQRGSAQHP